MWKYAFGRSPKPSKSKYEFKIIYPYNERKKESTKILRKYPNMVPIIIEKSDRSEIEDIDKHNYIFKKSAIFGYVMKVIRKKLKLDSSTSLYFYINNKTVPKVHDKLGDLYKKYRDKDLFLYITYT